MPLLTDLTGLLGISSVATALLLQLPRLNNLPRRYRIGVIALVFGVAWLPCDGLPLAGYVRGISGDLSITTVLLAWLAILRHPALAPLAPARQHLLVLVAAVALLFYPMTLGMTLLDPYRWGYSTPLFVAGVLLTATVAWWRHSHLIALCLALAVCVWSLGGYESSNLWDYLIDPLLAIYALAALCKAGVQGLRRR